MRIFISFLLYHVYVKGVLRDFTSPPDPLSFKGEGEEKERGAVPLLDALF
jgi:hypothetical protein